VEESQPIAVERPLEQVDNCPDEMGPDEMGPDKMGPDEMGPNEMDRSGASKLYGSVITMMLCWMIL